MYIATLWYTLGKFTLKTPGIRLLHIYSNLFVATGNLQVALAKEKEKSSSRVLPVLPHAKVTFLDHRVLGVETACDWLVLFTLPKTKIAPKNGGFQ